MDLFALMDTLCRRSDAESRAGFEEPLTGNYNSLPTLPMSIAAFYISRLVIDL